MSGTRRKPSAGVRSAPLSGQTKTVVRDLLTLPVETLGHLATNGTRGRNLQVTKLEQGEETSAGSAIPRGLAFHTHVLACRTGANVCGAAPPSSTDVNTFLKREHPPQHLVFSQEGTYVMDKSMAFGCSVKQKNKLVRDVKGILSHRSTAGEAQTRRDYMSAVNQSGCMNVAYFRELNDVRVPRT